MDRAGELSYNIAMAQILDVQDTPNPDSKKFLTDIRLVAAGAASFENAEAAKDHPLALALFNAGPVASVFMMDGFVTVTKFPNADWPALEAKLSETIKAKAVPVEAAAAASAGGANEALAKINAVIDENVRPALAGDGGGLEVLEFADNVLTVHYQGACGSCPSATAGTLFAIQNLLQRMVDPKIQVVSV